MKKKRTAALLVMTLALALVFCMGSIALASTCTVNQDGVHTPNGNGVYTDPTCTEDGYTTYHCSACDQDYTVVDEDTAGHAWADDWSSDGTGHWYDCDNCDETTGFARHADANDDGYCDACDFDMSNVTYAVTFKNFGSTVGSEQQIVNGGHASAPSDPTHSASGADYTFLGWSTANTSVNASTTTIVNVSEYEITGATTFYAVYNVEATGKSISATVSRSSGYTFSSTPASGTAVAAQIATKMSSVGGSLVKVKFDNPSTAYGTFYTNSSKNALSTSDYYYVSAGSGQKALSSVYFLAGSSKGVATLDYTAYDNYGNTASGTISLSVPAPSTDLSYSIDSDETQSFSRSDFQSLLRESYPSADLRYIKITSASSSGSSKGYVYYEYEDSDEVKFTSSTIDDYKYYYSDPDYGKYPINSLTYVPGTSTSDYSFELAFTAYGTSSTSVSGTMTIKVKAVKTSGSGDVTYTTTSDKTVELDGDDFEDYLQDVVDDDDVSLRYVRFSTTSDFSSSKGYIYYDYQDDKEKKFTGTTIDDSKFYDSNSSYGDYSLNDLTFVPGSNTSDYKVEIKFTAYGSSSSSAEGTLVIKVEAGSVSGHDIVYATTKNNDVMFDEDDFEDFFHEKYSNYDLSYIVLDGVPSTGTLYYNHDEDSNYGSSDSVKLTKSNYSKNKYYVDPSSRSNYDLSELSYVPSGSNYCVSIPFTAYSSSTRSVSGTVLISVTASKLSTVTVTTTKGTAVKLPSANIASAVKSATSTTLSYIQFVDLPATKEGTLYHEYTSSSKYDHKVATSKKYYTSGSSKDLIGDITFVPYSSFNSSVSLKYVAYNSSGKEIGVGTLTISVGANAVKYSDVKSSDWFYKYVMDLSNAGVVNGYPAGDFRPQGTVTYGEALKLIMLAADYSEPYKTGTHWASGYLTKAQSDGLISGTVNLDASISRLQVASIARKALNLSAYTGTSPFYDTSNADVLALYKAGVVEGSYDLQGHRNYYPNSTITRAEISTIIWRINNL